MVDSAQLLFAPSPLLSKGGYGILRASLRRGISHMCRVFAKAGASEEISALSEWIS